MSVWERVTGVEAPFNDTINGGFLDWFHVRVRTEAIRVIISTCALSNSLEGRQRPRTLPGVVGLRLLYCSRQIWRCDGSTGYEGKT